MNNPICSKEICTGCGACYNICPVQCIEMKADEEGFDYPIIDLDKCIDCRKCQDVCPMINSAKFHDEKEPTVYACWNKDEQVRYNSSSGGVFTALAEVIIEEGGIVYGAAYDDSMTVKHIGIDVKKDIERLRGSKYVQSNIGRTYLDIKTKLSEGKKVLFSGTPCQVAGLKNFIGDSDDNLITCDLLCHGVPSPQLFNKYIKHIGSLVGDKVIDYKFRDKRNGWGFNNRVAILSNGNEKIMKGKADTYIYGFANCFSLRNSCYKCQYTKIERVGDITLGDFWGIGEIDRFEHKIQKGVSLVLVNSKKGENIAQSLNHRLVCEKRSIKEAKHNRSKLSNPIVKPKIRDSFYEDYNHLNYEELSKKYLKDKGIKGLVKAIIPDLWIYKIRKLVRGK